MSKILLSLIAILLIFGSFFYPISALALPATFDKNYVLDTADISGLPARFSSPALIQSYLEDQNSMLASLQVEVSFEPDDIMVDPGQFSTLPSYLRPSDALAPYLGRELPVSEVIWMLSRGDAGNGCSFSDWNTCVNNRTEPLNPVFILAKIQKESGLVRGANSQLDPNSEEGRWLIERAMGYLCNGGPKDRSCYDENPRWKYFKGLFRQVYYGIRLLRINAERCNGSGIAAGGNIHVTGGTYVFGGVSVTYGNHLTCSLYVYTPYISAQDLLYRILVGMEADKGFISSPGPDSVPMRKASYTEEIESNVVSTSNYTEEGIYSSNYLQDSEERFEDVFADPAVFRSEEESIKISEDVVNEDGLDESEKNRIIGYVNSFFISTKNKSDEILKNFLVF